ncbi:unnamed protein product, partial [Schistocephalus solidus]|uniref:Pan3_PK domain-containing protein n=1 Tax=Schistocephalus solidus TaxID=70667 RepID=A0A183T072_SCHSO
MNPRGHLHCHEAPCIRLVGSALRLCMLGFARGGLRSSLPADHPSSEVHRLHLKLSSLHSLQHYHQDISGHPRRTTEVVWARRRVVQLRTWLDTFQQDMEAVLGPSVFGIRHWRKEWVELSRSAAANRHAWRALIFVYDYWPCSTTLQSLHLSGSPKSSSVHHFAQSSNSNESPKLDLLPEKTAWMYLVQLTQALRFTHKQANRSIGMLHPSKILLADFVALGKLMLTVIFGTTSAIQRPNAIQLISQVYKKELANLISDLLAGTFASVDTLTMVTAPYAYDHLASLYSFNDFLEQQLLREMECERLFRLICKLNSVVERNDVKRPDRSAPAWSETGDRYMLKLFRDFVFHQVDQCGAAHLDLAHIVNSLNK